MTIYNLSNGQAMMTAISMEMEIPRQKSMRVTTFLQYDRVMLTYGVLLGNTYIAGPVGYQIPIDRAELARFVKVMRQDLKQQRGGLTMIKKAKRM